MGPSAPPILEAINSHYPPHSSDLAPRQSLVSPPHLRLVSSDDDFTHTRPAMPVISDGNSTPATPALNTKTSPPWCLWPSMTQLLAPSLPSPCSSFRSWGVPDQHQPPLTTPGCGIFLTLWPDVFICVPQIGRDCHHLEEAHFSSWYHPHETLTRIGLLTVSGGRGLMRFMELSRPLLQVISEMEG